MSRYLKIREVFWPKGPRPDVWAILDCARHPDVFGALLDSHNNSACLYAGDISDKLERCAPHLVQLEYDDSSLTRRVIEEAWGQSWGIFLRCDASIDRLRRHLRQFLLVKDPGGRRLVFRYYDPRVLRVYLPTCFSGELDEVFGPVEKFWMEAEEPSSMLEFQRHANALVRNRIDL
jgi:hypothetical protein